MTPKKLSDFQVGESFMSKKDIAADQTHQYAKASGDFNPIHLNENFAKSNGFPGTILHGLCTMAMLAQCGNDFVGDPLSLRKIKVRFSKPVFPGDHLLFQGEVIKKAAEDSPLRLKINCLNQKEEVIISGAQLDYASPPAKDSLSSPSPQALALKDEVDSYTITAEKISQYAHAVGDSNPLFHERKEKGVVAPPLFCVVFAIPTFIRFFMGDTPFPQSESESKNFRGDLPRILHAGQEFDFFQPLKPGDTLFTAGHMEKKSVKRGQELIYYLTESWDADQKLAVLARFFAIVTSFST
jgi:acyl dehydratase